MSNDRFGLNYRGCCSIYSLLFLLPDNQNISFGKLQVLNLYIQQWRLSLAELDLESCTVVFGDVKLHQD